MPFAFRYAATFRRRHGPVQQPGLRVCRSAPPRDGRRDGGSRGWRHRLLDRHRRARRPRRAGPRRLREAGPALLERIAAANAELGDRVKAEPQLDGMGTTLIAILRSRDKLVLAHIGDSRAFLVRDGEVTQITKDHSFVQSLVDEGRITRRGGRRTTRSAPSSPGSSPGRRPTSPTSSSARPRSGDRYLICLRRPDRLRRRRTPSPRSSARPPTRGSAATASSRSPCAPGPRTTSRSSSATSSTSHAGPDPPTSPQVVGAAAAREGGTRPIPVTPAAKAAALARSTERAPSADDETSRSPRRGRAAGPGGSAGGSAPSPSSSSSSSAAPMRHTAGRSSSTTSPPTHGLVTVYRGRPADPRAALPLQPIATSDVAVSDLPDIYQTELAEGAHVGSRSEAYALVASLRRPGGRLPLRPRHGQQCRPVPDTGPSPVPHPDPDPLPVRRRPRRRRRRAAG